MFDVILNKIKECANTTVSDRLQSADEECVIAKLQPKSYDGCVCVSKLELICIAKTYDSALLSFDKICEGLDSLTEEEGEVLEISLENTVIKYDTVSGMIRFFGTFKCFTEVSDGGIN